MAENSSLGDVVHATEGVLQSSEKDKARVKAASKQFNDSKLPYIKSLSEYIGDKKIKGKR